MNASINPSTLYPAAAGRAVSGQDRPGRLSRWGTAVWQTLEAVGRSRARRELLALADRWQSRQPELAAQLRAACSDPRGA